MLKSVVICNGRNILHISFHYFVYIFSMLYMKNITNVYSYVLDVFPKQKDFFSRQ